MVPPRLKVEILVSWLWVKRCVFAGIKKLHGSTATTNQTKRRNAKGSHAKEDDRTLRGKNFPHNTLPTATAPAATDWDKKQEYISSQNSPILP